MDGTNVGLGYRVLSIESSLNLIAGLVFEIQHGDMSFFIINLFYLKSTMIYIEMKLGAFLSNRSKLFLGYVSPR